MEGIGWVGKGEDGRVEEGEGWVGRGGCGKGRDGKRGKRKARGAFRQIKIYDYSPRGVKSGMAENENVRKFKLLLDQNF